MVMTKAYLLLYIIGGALGFGYIDEEEPCGMAEYVVIGGGSSGAVVASRLALAGKCVTLMEAGPDDSASFVDVNGDPLDVFVPLQWPNQEYSAATYTFWSEDVFETPRERPEGLPADLGSEEGPYRVNSYQGKVLGGSSVANVMAYLRGGNESYEFGVEGWSAADSVKVFDDVEDVLGPLQTSATTPSGDAFQDALLSDGFRAFDGNCRDLANSPVDAFCASEQTIDPNGRRISSATAFLPPDLRASKYLTILTSTRALRLLFDDDRCVGVEYETSDEVRKNMTVANEVILSAGALLSPQLLMISGIGVKADLDALGIPVLSDLPVGRNLQTHVLIPHFFPLRQAGIGFAPNFIDPTQTGSELYAMMYSSKCSNCTEPDVSLLFFHAPTHQAANATERERLFSEPNGTVALGISRFGGVQGRSAVKLRSADPRDYPLYSLDFLHDDDLDVMVEAAERAQRIMQHRPDVFGDNILFGDDIRASLERTAQPYYHNVGTCKIGDVVDAQLKVIGLEGLRVADASIIPNVPNANTNPAALLVGYRAADLILNEE